MNYNYSLNRRLANVLRMTPIYPATKAIYRRTLNRSYLLKRKKISDFFGMFVEKDDLVFDVGANVGDFVDAFLHLGVKVCAVEPNQFCVEELKSLYGNNSQFILIDRALGSAESEGKMYLGEENMHCVSTLSEEWKKEAQNMAELKMAGWNKQVKVNITTLDLLIKKYGIPKLCKIDVEGFEYEVLQGLSQPLPMISLEYTPWRIDPTISCIDYLSNLSLYKFNITMSESRQSVGELRFKDWIDKDQVLKLINEEIRDTDIVGDLYAKAIS